jgi:hypothetical protein
MTGIFAEKSLRSLVWRPFLQHAIYIVIGSVALTIQFNVNAAEINRSLTKKEIRGFLDQRKQVCRGVEEIRQMVGLLGGTETHRLRYCDCWAKYFAARATTMKDTTSLVFDPKVNRGARDTCLRSEVPVTERNYGKLVAQINKWFEDQKSDIRVARITEDKIEIEVSIRASKSLEEDQKEIKKLGCALVYKYNVMDTFIKISATGILGTITFLASGKSCEFY